MPNRIRAEVASLKDSLATSQGRSSDPSGLVGSRRVFRRFSVGTHFLARRDPARLGGSLDRCHNWCMDALGRRLTGHPAPRQDPTDPSGTVGLHLMGASWFGLPTTPSDVSQYYCRIRTCVALLKDSLATSPGAPDWAKATYAGGSCQHSLCAMEVVET